MNLIPALTIAAVLLSGCALAPESHSSAGESSPSPTSREVDGCPVTIPPQPGFVPPEPYPNEPPELYGAVWYGTAELWTKLAPEGAVWEGLPDEDADGELSQKTLWWSKDYPTSEEPRPPVVVRGRRLDAPGELTVRRPAGGGFREDIGSFMLVGLEIPPGCWELTATYGDADFSYVVLVKDPN